MSVRQRNKGSNKLRLKKPIERLFGKFSEKLRTVQGKPFLPRFQCNKRETLS